MSFDPNFFLNTERALEEMDVSRPIYPSGEAIAYIGEYNEDRWLKSWEARMKDDGTMGQDRHTVNIPFIIQVDDEDIRNLLGTDKFTLYHNITLDVTPDGRIDTGKGKNWRLGALRKAVGQNYGGWWFDQLAGAGPLKIVISVTTDPKGGERNNISAVSAIEES